MNNKVCREDKGETMEIEVKTEVEGLKFRLVEEKEGHDPSIFRLEVIDHGELIGTTFFTTYDGARVMSRMKKVNGGCRLFLASILLANFEDIFKGKKPEMTLEEKVKFCGECDNLHHEDAGVYTCNHNQSNLEDLEECPADGERFR